MNIFFVCLKICFLGSKSYQNSLSVDASVSVDATVAADPSRNRTGWGAKFSASAGYKEVTSASNNAETTYVISVAKCIKYKATLTRRAQVKILILNIFMKTSLQWKWILDYSHLTSNFNSFHAQSNRYLCTTFVFYCSLITIRYNPSLKWLFSR